MAKVEIYTTKLCPYCYRAKALLSDKGAAFREIDVSFNSTMRQWLFQRTGRRTVPQIFINDQPVGGYDDIAALEQAGKLAELLSAPEASG
jgi:glutaredoxin 3